MLKSRINNCCWNTAKSLDGGNVDNASTCATFFEKRDSASRDLEHGVQIGVEQRIYFVIGKIFKWLYELKKITNIIYKNIQLAELFFDSCHHCLHLRCIGDIRMGYKHIIALFFKCTFNGVTACFVFIGNDDLGTVSGESFGDSATNACSASGNECNFPF